MKIFSLAIILVLLTVTGCSHASNVSPSSIEPDAPKASEEDFAYRLIVEKSEYQYGEPVKLYAELEYLGSEEQITIYHASSPFNFPIFETTRNYAILYAMDQPLLHTTIVKGKPLREEYTRGGGYSEQDDQQYVQFIKDFWENGFPKGHYVVNGSADFYVETEQAERGKKEYKLNSDVEFTVK